MARLNIGIAGAGIGGLSAAAALAADGHAVTVFDQFEQPKPLGSGLVIQPVGQDVLRHIGAGKMAQDHGQRVTRMLGHEAARDRAVLDVFYDPGGRNGRYGLAIHRAALFEAVLQAAKDAGATLKPGAKVTGISNGTERRLRFDDGTDSETFDLVIDALGAGSVLSPLSARALRYGAIWGTVDWPDAAALPDTQLSQRYRAARNMVGVLPIGRLPGDARPKAAIFWSLRPEDLEHWRAQPIDTWKAEATALWPAFAPFVSVITRHDQMTPAFYSHGTLRTPVAPGLVHIGDAAHRASPQLGQGANMALLDAWALRLSLRDTPDVAAALARYHKHRRRHLWLYQAMSAAFTPFYQSDSRVLPMLRDHVLTPLSRIPPMPRLLSRLVCGNLITPIRKGPLQ